MTLSKEEKALKAAFAELGFKPFPIKNFNPCRIRHSVRMAVAGELFGMVETIVDYGKRKGNEILSQQPDRFEIDIGEGITALIRPFNCLTNNYRLGKDITIYRQAGRVGPGCGSPIDYVSVHAKKQDVFCAHRQEGRLDTRSVILLTSKDARRALKTIQIKYKKIAAANAATKDQQN